MFAPQLNQVLCIFLLRDMINQLGFNSKNAVQFPTFQAPVTGFFKICAPPPCYSKATTSFCLCGTAEAFNKDLVNNSSPNK